MPGGDDSLSCVSSVDEIRAALQSLKNGRAPGGDEITSKLLKLGGEAVVQCLAGTSGFPGVGIWRQSQKNDCGS